MGLWDHSELNPYFGVHQLSLSLSGADCAAMYNYRASLSIDRLNKLVHMLFQDGGEMKALILYIRNTLYRLRLA